MARAVFTISARWDLSRPASIDNLVLMSADEAEAHEAAGGAPGTRRDHPAVTEYVEFMLATAAREHGILSWHGSNSADSSAKKRSRT